MSRFVKDKTGKSAIQKSEIATAKYTINKGGDVSLIFKLKDGTELNWFDYYEAEAKKIIEAL